MKMPNTKKTAGFIATFILSAAGFALAGVMMMGEANADPPQCPNNTGAVCNNGTCKSFSGGSCGIHPAYSTCATFGGSCLMGYPCNVIGPC